MNGTQWRPWLEIERRGRRVRGVMRIRLLGIQKFACTSRLRKYSRREKQTQQNDKTAQNAVHLYQLFSIHKENPEGMWE
jgi:hypothetical protein